MTEKPKTTGFEALAQETALYPQEKLAKVDKKQEILFYWDTEGNLIPGKQDKPDTRCCGFDGKQWA